MNTPDPNTCDASDAPLPVAQQETQNKDIEIRMDRLFRYLDYARNDAPRNAINPYEHEGSYQFDDLREIRDTGLTLERENAELRRRVKESEAQAISWESACRALSNSKLPCGHPNDYAIDLSEEEQAKWSRIGCVGCQLSSALRAALPAPVPPNDEMHRAYERIDWLEKQRDVECKQKEAALAESQEVINEMQKLREEMDALRLAFSEASHNAGPAFVAHEELTKLREELSAVKHGEDQAMEQFATAMIALTAEQEKVKTLRSVLEPTKDPACVC